MGKKQQLQRFWVSWWSGYFGDKGCTKPPYQIWASGERDRYKPGDRFPGYEGKTRL